MRSPGILLIAAALALVAPTAAPAQDVGDAGAVELTRKQARFAPGTAERSRRGHYPKGPARIGTTRTWLAVDWAHSDPGNRFVLEYLKDFTLRGMGRRVEVWVSGDMAFPPGDCRNSGDLLSVKQRHVDAIVRAFDERIFPRLTDAFFAPGHRDGSHAGLPALLPGMPADAYRGEGDNVVILLDNIRDARFYDARSEASTAGYVIGYWKDVYFDRHVMTIDVEGLDQLLGPTPEPAPAAGCGQRPRTPEFTESVMAHEYMHLLEDERDSLGAERPWMLEGLADAGARVAGYPAVSDQHRACFQGHGGEGCTPELSLSDWRDPGVRSGAQYGAAASLLESLPAGALAALLDDPGHGFESVRAFTRRDTADDLVDWTAGVAADVDWDRPQRFAGAPANGADYRRLPLGGVAFDGDETALVRTGWDRDGGTFTTRTGDRLDSTMVREVLVPADDPVLRFETRYDLEPGYDFGFVRVSEDGGATWRSLPGRGTTSQTAEWPDPRVIEALPGLTGASGGWVPEAFDLSAYAGRTVKVAFRYVTDAFVESAGWSVRDVRLGGTPLGGWEPPQRGAMRLRLAGLDEHDAVTGTLDVPLDAQLRGAVDASGVRSAVGPRARSLGAVVTFVEPMERHLWPARYELRVDGVPQPGG